MYEYDARGNNTKILFYTDDELESYITFEFDENNNEVAYRRGSVFSTDVVERISVYSDCLLLKSESTKNGQITATTTNTIEDGLIVAKEIINSRGEITRNYTYEYDCE
jgi:hypothetical protein